MTVLDEVKAREVYPRLEAAILALEDVEWIWEDVEGEMPYKRCPSCGVTTTQPDKERHYADCLIAKALLRETRD